MATTSNTSGDEGPDELRTITAGEPDAEDQIPLITVQEVLLSTAAARPVADRRKWWVSVTGPIRGLMRLTKRPPARSAASPRCKAFLEAARMSREMGRL
jgi:hypothetical protein